jgi:hypothetical protein
MTINILRYFTLIIPKERSKRVVFFMKEMTSESSLLVLAQRLKSPLSVPALFVKDLKRKLKIWPEFDPVQNRHFVRTNRENSR